MQTLVFNTAVRNAIIVPFVDTDVQCRAYPKAIRNTMDIIDPQQETETLTACLAAVGRSQDVEAFEILFRHFGPKIRAYMIKRGSQRLQAEELMQETMMMIWNKAGLFDPDRGTVFSWIFTLARNIRIDAHRKNSRPEFDPADPAFVPEPMMAADHILEANEGADRVRAALAQLPAEQAELLKFSFYEEISHSSIAERMNLPLGTVKSRIRLAFSRLRDMLEDAR